MSDLIDRQVAIDALTNYFAKWAEYAEWNHAVKNMVNVAQNSVEEMLIQLPSAQPEIIRCKDCKYWEREGTKGVCNDLYGFGRYWNPDDFCSYAERRTDEAD